jgi:polysaccharide pyruvyl transferase WcaK-like protein
MSVSLLNTSSNSRNTGDEIIVAAILSHFPELSNVESFSTHQFMTPLRALKLSASDIQVLTGTNILGSRLWPPSPWRFGPLEWAATRKKVLGVGLGWRTYENSLDKLQIKNYKDMFCSEVPVSTRDEYSASKLREIGVNAVNTGCPTMWSLPDVLPAQVKQQEVVATITGHSPDLKQDQEMLNILALNYERVLIWPQGGEDLRYLSNLRIPTNGVILNRGLESFNQALAGRVYVGTRLHAGIRASQLGCPSLVISIDNRAREIGKDTNYPILERMLLQESLQAAIFGLRSPTRLSLQRDVILDFKSVARKVIQNNI